MVVVVVVAVPQSSLQPGKAAYLAGQSQKPWLASNFAQNQALPTSDWCNRQQTQEQALVAWANGVYPDQTDSLGAACPNKQLQSQLLGQLHRVYQSSSPFSDARMAIEDRVCQGRLVLQDEVQDRRLHICKSADQCILGNHMLSQSNDCGADEFDWVAET